MAPHIQHLVHKVAPAGSWSGPPLDSVTLDYDERYCRRVVLTCEAGTRILLDLPDAQVLSDGDGLVTNEGATILIKAKPEALLEVRCQNHAHLLRVAWHLGNRHLPTELHTDRILIRADHVIADMLHKLGAETKEMEAPFNPEGGAYGHGRTHGH